MPQESAGPAQTAPQGFAPATMELVNPMPARPLIVVPYNAAWPAMYLVVALLVLDAIHLQVTTIDHVGSTSVPGLDAKPIIDIDVTVGDPADEQAYVPRLEAVGFTLVMRQPSWHGARMLVGELPWAAGVNLHVFPAGCEEVARHKALRDWLAMPAGAEDRARYVRAKRAAAEEVRRVGGTAREYNTRKAGVLRAILGRACAAQGLRVDGDV
ncbi:hypothetical protein ACHAQF_000486 [Verticillium nonalfalfae]